MYIFFDSHKFQWVNFFKNHSIQAGKTIETVDDNEFDE